MNETAALRQTPLHDRHVALGARMVPFAGFSMPVQFAGVIKEHEAVRTAAGLFDVSHMGELWLRGPGALAFADSLVTNAIHKLAVGRAKYTACCNEGGTILDDLIVYRVEDEEVLIVCNASNQPKISAHVAAHVGARCDFEDRSDATALLALQGPKAMDVARASGASEEMLGLKKFGVCRTTLGGHDVLVARTGYTGEDGVELFCENADAAPLFDHLMEAGEAFGLAPVGLGARDTLRLEACLCLYGNDIDETTNPYEAGLGWVVKLDGRDFIGKAALEKVKAEGPTRKLVGLEMVDRGIARHGYPILDADGAAIGEVCSGSPGPTVGKNIGLGYVPTSHAEPGTEVGVEIRGKVKGARVAATPFYRRQS